MILAPSRPKAGRLCWIRPQGHDCPHPQGRHVQQLWQWRPLEHLSKPPIVAELYWAPLPGSPIVRLHKIWE